MAAPPSWRLFDLKERPRVGFFFFISSPEVSRLVLGSAFGSSRTAGVHAGQSAGRSARGAGSAAGGSGPEIILVTTKKLALNTPTPDEAGIY